MAAIDWSRVPLEDLKHTGDSVPDSTPKGGGSIKA
jgi:hypothetical protein